MTTITSIAEMSTVAALTPAIVNDSFVDIDGTNMESRAGTPHPTDVPHMIDITMLVAVSQFDSVLRALAD